MSGGNTVMGVPERAFCKVWIARLWAKMSQTGKGYHRPSTKNRPPKGATMWYEDQRWLENRRPDKAKGTMAGMPKWFRGYAQRTM